MKYKYAGRMTGADVAWWTHYLAVIPAEARPQPATTVQSSNPSKKQQAGYRQYATRCH